MPDPFQSTPALHQAPVVSGPEPGDQLTIFDLLPEESRDEDGEPSEYLAYEAARARGEAV